MYHWLSAAKGTVSLPYVKWGDTWYLAFLVAVPPAGPDDGATTLITGPDWTVTYNYATGLVTVTRGTSVLSASLTPDHCFHRIVWAHNDSTDVASLYLDNVSTPVAVDTTAGFATLTGGTVTIGTGVAYSVLIGDLRISQNVFDPVAAAGWGDPIGCCFDKCSTTVNPDDAAAGPVALHYEYNGVDNRTLPWPIRANPGSLSIRARGGMGGRWQDVVAGQGGMGHVNEQWHTYWDAKFIERGFHRRSPWDLRQAICDHPEIEWWYKQNLALYCRGHGWTAPAGAHDESGAPRFLDGSPAQLASSIPTDQTPEGVQGPR